MEDIPDAADHDPPNANHILGSDLWYLLAQSFVLLVSFDTLIYPDSSVLELERYLPSRILNRSAFLIEAESVSQLLFDLSGELVVELLLGCSSLADMLLGSNLLVVGQRLEVVMPLDFGLGRLHEQYLGNAVVGSVVEEVMTVLRGIESGHSVEKGSASMIEVVNVDCFGPVMGSEYLFQNLIVLGVHFDSGRSLSSRLIVLEDRYEGCKDARTYGSCHLGQRLSLLSQENKLRLY